jgi:DNA-binding response OmpR family regulator
MALKILIVDDDFQTLELLREVLSSMGADVRCIDSPIRALDLAQREKFDGVIVDVMMPEMDGAQLTTEIRKTALNRQTTIVGVSGSDDQKTMQSMMSAGATFFLHKPFDRANLMRRLNSTRGSMMQEQRRFVRVPIHTEVTGTAGNLSIRGTARDISEGGICFISTAPLHPGMNVTVATTLPGQDDHFEAAGSVVRATQECLVSVQFQQLESQKLVLVREFVRQHLSRSWEPHQ